MGSSIRDLDPRYLTTCVITDPDHPYLASDAWEGDMGGMDTEPPVLVITDLDDPVHIPGDPGRLAAIGERIHAATSAAFPEQSRMRFIYPGSPEPVCLCGNGDETRPGVEDAGFYLGDDVGRYAGRAGAYSTVVCRSCRRAGTFPLGAVPTTSTMGAGSELEPPRPRVIPGFGFIVAIATTDMVVAADQESTGPGDWRA